MGYNFEEYEDFIIEDNIFNKKNKINSKKKGNRSELALSKVLNKRFGGGFSRSIGSGNRWSQASLPDHAKQVFTGDLVTPENFRYVIESKGGYDKIDLNLIFNYKNKELESFLEQAKKDAKRCKKKPLLCWKKARMPWVCAIQSKEIRKIEFNISIKYKEWTILNLEELLVLEDSFFFV